MDCYIYFKASAQQVTEVMQQEALLQAAIGAQTGISARLQRRPQASDDCHTWMEIYRAVPPGFEAQLAQALAQTALPGLVHGERHAEYFVDATPCA
ncbi:MAG: DUF4936 family protein [Burkholderiales bacterium]|nr:DUF4936 family protein [Burkholderiales bacterium]